MGVLMGGTRKWVQMGVVLVHAENGHPPDHPGDPESHCKDRRVQRRLARLGYARESIGSSTRIEGSKLSDREVEQLLSNLEIKSFATRDEQEVVGYAELMDLVFSS